MSDHDHCSLSDIVKNSAKNKLTIVQKHSVSHALLFKRTLHKIHNVILKFPQSKNMTPSESVLREKDLHMLLH